MCVDVTDYGAGKRDAEAIAVEHPAGQAHQDYRAGERAEYHVPPADKLKPWWQRAWDGITTTEQDVVNTVSGAVAGILHPPQKTGSYKLAAPVKDGDPPWQPIIDLLKKIGEGIKWLFSSGKQAMPTAAPPSR